MDLPLQRFVQTTAQFFNPDSKTIKFLGCFGWPGFDPVDSTLPMFVNIDWGSTQLDSVFTEGNNIGTMPSE